MIQEVLAFKVKCNDNGNEPLAIRLGVRGLIWDL